MKACALHPLLETTTPLSDHIDLDESQMSYGTKSSTSGDSNSMSNDFVSCDNSDKSSEVNINDFASSDSSVISSEPKSKDSTSYASTSSATSVHAVEEISSQLLLVGANIMGMDGQLLLSPQQVNLHTDAGDEGIVDSGCSRSMTGNKERLDDFQSFKGGKVTFGGGEGRITGKGTIRTPKLDFENVYYVKELQ
ncbi:hypothetical protein Tco_0488709 [Tanacetum coccineum]